MASSFRESLLLSSISLRSSCLGREGGHQQHTGISDIVISSTTSPSWYQRHRDIISHITIMISATSWHHQSHHHHDISDIVISSTTSPSWYQRHRDIINHITVMISATLGHRLHHHHHHHQHLLHILTFTRCPTRVSTPHCSLLLDMNLCSQHGSKNWIYSHSKKYKTVKNSVS